MPDPIERERRPTLPAELTPPLPSQSQPVLGIVSTDETMSIAHAKLAAYDTEEADAALASLGFRRVTDWRDSGVGSLLCDVEAVQS